MDQSKLSRRSFLRSAGLSATALTLGCYGIGAAIVRPDKDAGPSTELMSWISIDESGQVTIFNHRSEMGQGTWQSIPQIVAEELVIALLAEQIKGARGSCDAVIAPTAAVPLAGGGADSVAFRAL